MQQRPIKLMYMERFVFYFLVILGVDLLLFVLIVVLSMTDDRIEGLHLFVLSSLIFLLTKIMSFPMKLMDLP